MISSSIGPSGVDVTGLAAGAALSAEPPHRPKKPDRCFGCVVVCVDDESERILGDGEAALEVAGVA